MKYDIASDPICNIALPKTDEIQLNSIGNHGDRWFLGVIDAYDSWIGCAKARAEYMMKNREFLDIPDLLDGGAG